MTNTKTLAKEQIIETVLASLLVTDAEAGVKFSDHREFLRIECIESAPFLCKPQRTWVVFAACKEIARDDEDIAILKSPFSIKAPEGFPYRPMKSRLPGSYLGEILEPFSAYECRNSGLMTHGFKVPHQVFLDLLK